MAHMDKWIPNKFFLWVVIGLICVVFIFLSGTGQSFLPSYNAGEVNGEVVTLQEYNQVYNRMMNQYQERGGKGMDPAMLKRLPIHDWAFNQIVGQKVLMQEAERLDLVASQEAVIEYLKNIPIFQDNGRFNSLKYKEWVRRQGLSFAKFEESIQEDLTRERVRKFFENHSRVSTEEIKREFKIRNDKRQVKYVFIKFEHGQKDVKVGAKEIKEFLANEGKQKIVKSRYEGKKTTDYKGKKYDQVKNDIAREIIVSTKVSDIQKNIDVIVEKVIATMTPAKSSDGKVNGLLKKCGVKVEESEELTQRGSKYLKGVGEVADLFKDAFLDSSPIAKKAKKYKLASGTVVAVLSKIEKADLAKLDSKEMENLRKNIERTKGVRFSEWHRDLTQKAKVVKNPNIVRPAEG